MSFAVPGWLCGPVCVGVQEKADPICMIKHIPQNRCMIDLLALMVRIAQSASGVSGWAGPERGLFVDRSIHGKAPGCA